MSTGEEGVDDLIHKEMLRMMVEEGVAAPTDGNRVLILVTGDGNDNEGRGSFPDVCSHDKEARH